MPLPSYEPVILEPWSAAASPLPWAEPACLPGRSHSIRPITTQPLPSPGISCKQQPSINYTTGQATGQRTGQLHDQHRQLN